MAITYPQSDYDWLDDYKYQKIYDLCDNEDDNDDESYLNMMICVSNSE